MVRHTHLFRLCIFITITLLVCERAACVPETRKHVCGYASRFPPKSSSTISKLRHGAPTTSWHSRGIMQKKISFLSVNSNRRHNTKTYNFDERYLHCDACIRLFRYVDWRFGFWFICQFGWNTLGSRQTAYVLPIIGNAEERIYVYEPWFTPPVVTVFAVNL